jgi:hypothetical protein
MTELELNQRVSFEPLHSIRKIQVSKGIIDGRDAFLERVYFPHSCFENSKTTYYLDGFAFKSEKEAQEFCDIHEPRAYPSQDPYNDEIWSLATDNLEAVVMLWDKFKTE